MMWIFFYPQSRFTEILQIYPHFPHDPHFSGWPEAAGFFSKMTVSFSEGV
jgi:hypothetical protein